MYDVFDGDLQRAALAPDLWPDLLHRIGREAGALGAILISEDHEIPVPPISSDLVPLMDRYYREGWNARDVRFRGTELAFRNGAVTDGEILSDEEMRASPYYQELLRPEGCLCFCSVHFRVAGASWFLTLQRTIAQGAFTPGEVARLAALRRPLASAAGLSHALSFARISGVADAFEHLAKPALILDEGGSVIRCNAGAEQVLAALAGLRHREIRFHDARNQRSFDSALAQAEAPAQWSGRPSTPARLRHAAGRSWSVEATALGDWARYSFTQARHLVLLDEVRTEASAAARSGARHALTPAEASVAEGIAAGLTLREIADHRAVTYETVRTQLKAVMSKTGCRRQTELARLLLHGPGKAGA